MLVNQKKLKERHGSIGFPIFPLHSNTSVCLRATHLFLQFKLRMSWHSASSVCRLAMLPWEPTLQSQLSFRITSILLCRWRTDLHNHNPPIDPWHPLEDGNYNLYNAGSSPELVTISTTFSSQSQDWSKLVWVQVWELNKSSQFSEGTQVPKMLSSGFWSFSLHPFLLSWSSLCRPPCIHLVAAVASNSDACCG